ncbi:MAG TPA: TonB-dependent receptor plug domain-containing protein, partial [Gemmatimonadaceae bacterium]
MCISVVRGIVIGAGCIVQAATVAAGQAVAPVRIAAASIRISPPPRMQGVTSVQRGRVTLDMNNVPLGKVLAEIERQGDVTLLYSTDVVNVNRRVSISIRQATVSDALSAALRGTGVIARVDGPGRVTLEGRGAPDTTQTGTIRGRVVDAKSGEGVPQATIALQGSRYATLANEDGRYLIAKIEPGTYTLVARRIGYEPANESIVIAAGQDTDVTIRLRQSANILDKVIVTGTIVPTEVRAVPTPVTVISAEQIEQQDFRRLDQAVRMFVPSALSWDTGPNAEQDAISVRGASSLALGSPIKVYVDGIEVASSNFTMMDPSSVERVEVIRGPQAATMYGSDAMGGVMQVFTKKGNAALDRPELDLKVSLGTIQSPYKSGGTLRQDYSAVVRGGTSSASYSIGGSFSHTGDWLPYYYLSTPSAFGGVHIAQGKLSLDLSGRYMNTKEPAFANPFLVS